MAVFLAILSAAAFGGADFVGGLASRRASAISVVVTGHLMGLAVVVAVAPWFGSAGVGIADFLWGAAAGASGALGLTLLYHALATTRFSVAAPAAALLGAAVPVVFGLAIGERPSAAAWIGIAIALPAILLISGLRNDGSALAATTRRAVWLGSAAGVLFGLWGVFISRTADTSGAWPLVGARLASLLTMAAVAVVMARPLLATGKAMRISLAVGAADMAANMLLLAALHEPGLVSLVLLISALYPAGTVLLARVVLHERMSRTQVVGLLLAGIGIGLIAAG
ncbi:MAG: EamA family transporter [Acidimicrobiia bacterium]|nr:EamA family transporter [Acidimicrobiia bacterium]